MSDTAATESTPTTETVGTSSEANVSEQTTIQAGNGPTPDKSTPESTPESPETNTEQQTAGDPPFPSSEEESVPQGSLLDDGMPPNPMEWLTKVPEEYRTKASFTKHKSFDEFVKSYDNLSSMLHKRGLVRPDENTTAEDRAAWNEHIGVPSDSGQYAVPDIVREMPDDVKKSIFGENGFEPMLKIFHNASMNQDQVNIVTNAFDQVLADLGQRELTRQEVQRKQAYNNAISELKQEWGPNYESNLRVYSSQLERKGLVDVAKRNGWENNPDFIRMVHAFGKDNAESSIVGTAGPASGLSFDDQKAYLVKERDAGRISKQDYMKRKADLYEKRNNAVGR